MAVFTKKGKKYGATGKLLYGAVPNNTVFAGFGNRCGVSNNSDSVVRYDQLADRWLIVVPVFSRPPGCSWRSPLRPARRMSACRAGGRRLSIR